MKFIKTALFVSLLALCFCFPVYGQNITYTPFSGDEGSGYYLTYDFGGGHRQIAIYASNYSGDSITILSSASQNAGVWDNKAGATVAFIKNSITYTVTYNGNDAKKLFNSLGWPNADDVWAITDSGNSSVLLTIEKVKNTKV